MKVRSITAGRRGEETKVQIIFRGGAVVSMMTEGPIEVFLDRRTNEVKHLHIPDDGFVTIDLKEIAAIVCPQIDSRDFVYGAEDF